MSGKRATSFISQLLERFKKREKKKKGALETLVGRLTQGTQGQAEETQTISVVGTTISVVGTAGTAASLSI